MELTQEGKSQREIAAVLGVDHTTVLDNQKAGGNPPKPTNSSKKNSKDIGGNPPPASTTRKRDAHPESDDPPANSNMVNRLQSHRRLH